MASLEPGPASLECIHRSEAFPKRPMQKDEDDVDVPFPVLSGESVEYLGKTADGTIALSNFRLFIRFKDSFVNVPLGLIESVECLAIFYMQICCKDSKAFRCAFATNETCLEWYRRISLAISLPEKLDDFFAFAFHAWCVDPSHQDDQQPSLNGGDESLYSSGKEVERMGFDLKKVWRICQLNEDYKVSPSYPKYHIVPISVSDKDVESVAAFRSSRRFPSVVWRSRQNGAVIARCSQPEVGWLGWRNSQDEQLLLAIAKACVVDSEKKKGGESVLDEAETLNGSTSPSDGSDQCEARKLLIVDARSYGAAFANRAKGGGCECIEYYPNCEIQFMNLANIHAIRKSYLAVRALCAAGPEQPNWYSGLETTKWLQHIANLMRAAVIVVNAIDKEQRPVLVHCSDGWDRTPQIVALAELQLDAYYRTIQGFQALVEREWLDFGHKFGDRCGNGVNCDDVNERCPAFLQWLDCIHQLQRQFPCAFEFNETFLVKLAQHVYSRLFGTFLCNSAQERERGKVRERAFSVWTLLRPDNKKFKNFLYSSLNDQVLRPSCNVSDMELWSSIYLSSTSSMPVSKEVAHEDEEYALEAAEFDKPLHKTKSCDDIIAALENTSNLTRRLSDPNIVHSGDAPVPHSDPLFPSSQPKINGAESNASSDISSSDEPKGELASETQAEEEGQDLNGLQGYDSDAKKGSSLGEESTAGQSSEETDPSVTLVNGQDCDHLPNGHSINDTEGGESSSEQEKSEFRSVSVASSTDTLIGADCTLPQQDRSGKELTNGHSDTCLYQNGGSGVEAQPSKSQSFQNYSTISTSTTDISDSQVKQRNPLSLHLKCYTTSCKPSCAQAANSNGKASSSSMESDRSTPYYSRTPSSTCPPTPGTDKQNGSSVHRSISMVARHLDCDGLTTFEDEIHQRLQQKEEEYQNRIAFLMNQLRLARRWIPGVNGLGRSGDKDDVMSLPESTEGDEHMSLNSNAASDASWEPLEEQDARVTLWVPDHVVTHCAGCDGEFYFARRRHHCRNCGQVFCGSCTNNFIPVPQQQLFEPSRVCKGCYINLKMSASGYGAEEVRGQRNPVRSGSSSA
ncbi:myotubularin-related protein 4 [Lingula anatina]|uniref:phosphatidylinositol-3,5-bisphosphate 3-phosphatase n=1 Tax=Lingula anatina TaxID=7574 RepID=A0A1S3JQ84_LINAN|nr:myotubularin-related protein 4 [Lingula anatina]|eukprot:XP_013412124.1 myotubularin-related protein 4 [Lingula anatina]